MYASSHITCFINFIFLILMLYSNACSFNFDFLFDIVVYVFEFFLTIYIPDWDLSSIEFLSRLILCNILLSLLITFLDHCILCFIIILINSIIIKRSVNGLNSFIFGFWKSRLIQRLVHWLSVSSNWGKIRPYLLSFETGEINALINVIKFGYRFISLNILRLSWVVSFEQ